MEKEHTAAKEAEYRDHAADLLRLAEETANDDERATLRRMADAWLKLADRLKGLFRK